MLQRKILGFGLGLLLILVLAVPGYTQTPSPSPSAPTRESVIQEIKDLAKRHVDLYPSPQPSALEDFKNNTVGLDASTIRRTYEEEFKRLKEEKESNLGEQIKPQGGWIVAALFALFAIFRNTITERVTSTVKAIDDKIYSRFAGSKLFTGRALKRYRQALIEKHQELKIPFRPNRPLQTRNIYVPLKVAGAADRQQIDADQAILHHRRLMVKGPPGSGKSMLLKYFALSYAEDRLTISEQPVLLLLELHRITNADTPIGEYLLDALKRNGFPNAYRFIEQGLESGSLMLLLDGLDEVNSKIRPQVVQKVKDLLDDYSRCRVVITCRTQVYRGEFDAVVDQTLEVIEFTDQQIRSFLRSWEQDMPAEKSIDQLMQTLHNRPQIMALARNPLLLTIIAYLYSDTPFVLPYSRAEFYQKSTDILLDQWHQEHNYFQARDKRLVLRHLALHNQDTANQRQQDRRSIEHRVVLEQIRQVLPGLNLPPEVATPLLNEIVERSGLLLSIDGGERYQFVHLTLQEYFAALALLEDEAGLVVRFKTDPDAWRETVKLWCGLVGDSTKLIQQIAAKDPVIVFECLADAQKVEQETANKIIAHFAKQLSSSDPENTITKAFGAVAGDARSRGKTVFQFLATTLATDRNSNRYLAAATALSLTNLPDAAKQLARYYTNHQVRPALIRMGELAVPELVDLAIAGSEEALDDLVEIGTSNSAEKLVPLLWHTNKRLAIGTAWRLAALLPQPGVEEALINQELGEREQSNQWTWIWLPFYDPAQPSLQTICIQMAILISQAPVETISNVTRSLYPQLVIPLCTIQLNKEISVFALREFQSELDSLLQISEDTSSIERQKQLISRILEQIEVSPRWRYLYNGLELSLQLDLLYRLAKNRLPTQEDWRNLFQPVQYEFEIGWHYRLISVLALILSSIALVQIVVLPVRVPENWLNWVGVFASVFIINFWLVMWRGLNHRLESDLFVWLGLLGPVKFLIELQRLWFSRSVWTGIEAFYEVLISSQFGKIFAVTSAIAVAFAVAVAGATAVTSAGAIAGAFAFAGAIAGAIAVAFAGACADAGAVAGAVAGAIAGAFAFAFAGAVAVAIAGAGAVAIAGAGAFIVAFFFANLGAFAVAFAIAVAGAGVFAGSVAVAIAGAIAGGAGAGAIAGSVAVALAVAGVSFWIRAKSEDDAVRFLAVLAAPLFCWLPLVFWYATLFLQNFLSLSWTAIALVWFVVAGMGTGLWLRGQQLDRQARNPLQGILPQPSVNAGEAQQRKSRFRLWRR